jgi:hypothetical protein
MNVHDRKSMVVSNSQSGPVLPVSLGQYTGRIDTIGTLCAKYASGRLRTARGKSFHQEGEHVTEL